MSDQKLFTVRPTSKQPRIDYKECFRICLSPASLVQVKLRIGELCQLHHPSGGESEAEGGQAPLPKTAIAWTAPEKIHDTVVQTSKQLQELYGFKLGDKISITPAADPLAEITIVRLEEQPSRIGGGGNGSVPAELSDTERPHWEWGLAYPLSRCEIVSEGMTFELDLKGSRRRFKVVEINSGRNGSENTISQFTDKSRIVISNAQMGSGDAAQTRLEVSSQGLGGLGPQLERINERLRDFDVHEDIIMPSFYKNSGGILIYGAKGTGKSTVLSKIEEAGWRKVFNVNSSVMNRSVNGTEGATILRNIFTDALKYQPSLIAIDQLDYIAPKRGSNEASLFPILCEGLDRLQDSSVLVVGCTRQPNDVDETLRTPHRLGIEIELPVPTAKARLEILLALRGPSAEPGDALLKDMATRTHGYVGADLFSLLQLACRKAKTRTIAHNASIEEEATKVNGDFEKPARAPLQIQDKDISLALRAIRPTAMREVFLETPNVKWTDIGGQRDIKRRLQKAVERPVKVYILFQPY